MSLLVLLGGLGAQHELEQRDAFSALGPEDVVIANGRAMRLPKSASARRGWWRR